MKKLNLKGTVGGYIDIETVQEFLNEANGEEIEVTLYSYGGSVFEGFEILNLFSSYQGHKTLILGSLVASAATYMILAFDKVIAQDTSSVMIHEVTSYMEGTEEQLIAESKRVKELQNIIATKFAKKMNKTVEEVQALLKAETWFRGQEIVDNNLADELRETGNSENILSINYLKSKVKNYYYNNKIEEKQDMTKQEVLNEAKKAGLTVGELATFLGASNVLKTEDENRKLKEFDNLENKVKTLEMDNALNEAFGNKSDKNVQRIYAETLYKNGMSIEDMKKDVVMQNLAAKKAAGVETVDDPKNKGKKFDAEAYN